MTSILDQYEEAVQSSSNNLRTASLKTPAMENMYNFEKEDDIFTIRRITSIPPITREIDKVLVGGDCITFSTSNSSLFFFNWKKDGKNYKELELKKATGNDNGGIRGFFMDPFNGNHVLICWCQNVNGSPSGCSNYLYYCNTNLGGQSQPKLKSVSKMNNHVVTAVAWSSPKWYSGCGSNCTGPLLLGTSKGLIFEMEIDATDTFFQSNVENYCREVFEISSGDVDGKHITGLAFGKLAGETTGNEAGFFILVTTRFCMYQFSGGMTNAIQKPMLQRVFQNYLDEPEPLFHFPSGGKGRLELFYKEETARAFGWNIPGKGVVYGQIVDGAEGVGPNRSICSSNRMLEYKNGEEDPIGFVITEFHAILLYEKKIMGMSAFNKHVYFHFDASKGEDFGKYRDILQDGSGNIWVYSKRAIFQCELSREDRFLWKIYMECEQFDLAKHYCYGDRLVLHEVMREEARYYFNAGALEKSADIYAKIRDICPFEEVALLFLQISEMDGLKVYLKEVLLELERISTKGSASSPNVSTQRTMLTLWLVELYEKQMCQLADEKDEKYSLVMGSLQLFLEFPDVASCVASNKEVVYKLLESYGDGCTLKTLYQRHSDYEKLVRHYVESRDLNGAFQLLEKGAVPEIVVERFAGELLELAPKECVDLFVARKSDPNAILRHLIALFDKNNIAGEAIRYLEYCVNIMNSQDECIHNFLITLYAKYDPGGLMRYLAMQGDEASLVNYDIKYALKVCQEADIVKGCVHLSALLCLWENAVDMALKVKDVALAKQTAAMPNQKAELSKKLWLKIAQWVVAENDQDVKKAMGLLQQCDNAIKIEDILTLFPDFTTIDNFKDAICTSLQEYGQSIELLKEEMEDASKSAASIHEDIENFKKEYATVECDSLCDSCSIRIMLRPFYIFPCGHRFHTDCLMDELNEFLDTNHKQTLKELQAQLASIPPGSDDNVSSRSSIGLSARDRILSEIDDIVASQCFFCGDILIQQIDKPFVKDEQFEEILEEWL